MTRPRHVAGGGGAADQSRAAGPRANGRPGAGNPSRDGKGGVGGSLCLLHVRLAPRRPGGGLLSSAGPGEPEGGAVTAKIAAVTGPRLRKPPSWSGLTYLRDPGPLRSGPARVSLVPTNPFVSAQPSSPRTGSVGLEHNLVPEVGAGVRVHGAGLSNTTLTFKACGQVWFYI